MDASIPFYLSYAALWILVVFQSLILLGLVRIVYQLQRNTAMASLAEGQEVPKFSAVDLSGTPINSTNLAGRMTALLFVSTTCSSCAQTLSEDMDYLRHKAQGNIIVVCRALREECVHLVQQYNLDMPIVADPADQIGRLFGVTSVPTVVLINENNRIQSTGQPKRGNELEELIPKMAEAGLQLG